MILNNVFFDDESWNKIYKGLQIVAGAVAPTMGSRGRNVMFRPFKDSWPKVTNDGVSIARHIFLQDESEAMGADYIKQACERTNEQVGDGTSSVCLLAYHLITEGRKMLKSGEIGAPQLRKELEKAVDEAIKLLGARATKITTEEELFRIAKISSEDDAIAKLVSGAVTEVGEHGTVLVEESEGIETIKEKIDGFEFDQGFISPYFITHPDKMQAIFNDVHILLTDKKFTFNKEIFPILKECADNDIRQMVIVCQDAQTEALATILSNKVKGNFVSVVVKIPRDSTVLEDLADVTGAKIISSEKGDKFSLNKLGKVRKVVVSKDKTLISKGERSETEKASFDMKMNFLEGEIKTASDSEKKHLKERLARLTNSVVIIKAGAPLEQEMRYLKDKIDDAVCAVNAAKAEGYVVGGGLTLKSVTKEVNDKLGTAGSKLLEYAGEMPIKTLVANAGVEYQADKINDTDGFDTDTSKYTKNLIDKGIIDPVLVEKSILKNAGSSAGIFLTLHCHLEGVFTKEEPKA